MRLILQALYQPACKAIVFTFLALLSFRQSTAQCPNDNNLVANVGSIPCGIDGSIAVGAGTAVTFPVVANATYIFRTCGSTPLTGATFNTQLTGYDNIGGLAFYNDDAGGFCANCTSAGCSDPGSTATESYVSWPSTFTGTVRVNVDVFNCNNCTSTNCPALGSAALQYRQVNNLFFTSSGAAMCSGTSRSLTAVPPGGTFTGTGVSGNTFTAPTVGGTYTITYTLGSCSATQDIVVNSFSTAPTTISGTTNICAGGSTTLTVADGTLGSGDQWVWYSGSCGGVFVASGTNSIVVNPASATTYYVRAEGPCGNTACASAAVTITNPSTAPIAINASASTICNGQSVTLTSSGGTLGAGGVRRWYSGSCGGTLVGTGNSIVVSPTVTTDYFVRAEDPSPCNTLTACATRTITVNQPSVAPTGILGNASVCTGGSTTLTVDGGSLGTGANWQWYSNSCGGTFVGSGPSVVVSPVANTTYYVRAEGALPCATTTACASLLVMVNTASTPPASVNASVSLICNGQSTTLTANGATLGTGGVITWYSGSCGGTLVGTGNPIVVSPTATTDYYVRVEDPSPCGTVTSCASTTITVNQPSVAPTSISGASTICTGGNTTLTVQGGSLGTGADWQWYSNSCGGTFVGSGPSINVSPLANTTYYVRAEGALPCSPSTACASLLVVVDPLNTDPTGVAGGGTICEGTSATLTVVGGSIGSSSQWTWYEGGCGLGVPIATGISISVTPATATDYYVRGEGLCNTTNCAFTNVAINDSSVEASSISGTASLCTGASTNLSVVGGSLGVGADWYWYSGSCGGTLEGTGVLINVSPTTTTTYYLRAEGTCNNTVCVPFTVTVTPLPNGSISNSMTLCAGVTDTVLTFNFPTGSGPFDIDYTDGTTTFSRTGVNDGDTIHVAIVGTVTYSFVQITDANGCIRNAGFAGTATITVATLPFITNVTTTPVLCNGTSTASITITGSSGTLPYSYSIDAGGSFQASNVFSGLPSGSYDLVIADVNGCSTVYGLNPVVFTDPAVLDHTDSVGNASCASVFDGSITVTATGGTTPYNYSLNGGPLQPGNSFTGLTSGSYIVQVTDANGCTDTSQVSIDTVYAVTGSIVAQTNVSCFGGNDGTVTVDLIGGVPAYDYSINGIIFQPSPAFVGLSAGNYVVTLRDSKGCTDFVPVNITEPSQLQVAIDTAQNILCNGDSTGAIFITVSGGTAPYSFVWSNGDTTEDATNLGAGPYNVSVTDGNGCFTSAGATVTEPLPLFLSIASYQDLLCNGDSSGAIDITVNGGTPAYTFIWSDGETFEDIYNLPIGTYTVTVSDANGCADSVGQTIIEPTALSSVIVPTNATCPGSTDGSIDITITGGTPGYAYFWSNGSGSEDPVNLGAGNYTVIVNDANGCTLTDDVTIIESGSMTLTAAVTNASCGSGGGAVDLTVTGGIAPYTFNWSNGVTNEDLTNVNSGVYSVTVIDANLCSATFTTVVFQAQGLILSSTSTNVLCFGDANGAIDLTAVGGVSPYTYLWNTNDTTEDLTGLVAGIYTVTVTDVNSCSSVLSATVTQPFALALNYTPVNVSCAGGNDGSLDITIQGGVFPYSFAWSTGVITEDANGLTAGNYDVTVVDFNGCSLTQSFTLNEPTAITSSVTGTNVTCFGTSDGTIDLAVADGTPPYTFLWSNFESTEDLDSVSGGTYYVIITDANGCEKRDSVTITEAPSLVLTATVTNILCFGDTTGAIDLTVSGGTPTYTYSWDNGATTEDITGVWASAYSVTVTDAASCSATLSETITEPAAMVMNATPTNVGCGGGNNGAVDITVQGGVFPYMYAWSTGATTEDISGLSGGTYDVTVLDNNGCSLTQSFTLTEPTAVASILTATNVTCYGGNDGAVDLLVSGGTAPYTFLWSTFQGTEDIGSLSATTYFVIITDANGCEKRDSIVVTQPAQIVLTTNVTGITCSGGATGVIDLSVTDGTPGYTYLWTNGATAEDVSGLVAGSYTVTVTDTVGCTASTSVTLQNVSPLTAILVVQHPNCFGDSTGVINLSVNGGTTPYTFAWSNGATNEDLTGLAGGMYTVTVTDVGGCSLTDSATVTAPPQLYLSGVVKHITCFGDNDGEIDITPYGGNPPYAFTWAPGGESTEDLWNQAPGTDTVTVSDANGCLAATIYSVNEPALLTANAVSTNVRCAGTGTGTLAVIPAGGTAPYAYQWNTFSIDSSIPNAAAGFYSVLVTDSNGCTAFDTVSITEPQQMLITGVVTNAGCFGDTTGAVNVTVTGGAGTLIYVWSNGDSTEDLTNVGAGLYTVVVTDSNACVKSASFTVGQGEQIYVSLAVTPPVCNGGSSGSITAIVNGGVFPYTYTWSTATPQTGITAGGLKAGAYTVTVRDAASCSVAVTDTITDPPAIEVTTIATGARCYNTATGSVITNVTGGTAPYTYLLNAVSQTGGVFTNLPEGDYQVLVTDVNGCQGTDTFSVSAPSEITVDLGVTQQVILTGMQTQLVANATSTVPVVNYIWSPDTVFDFSACSDPFNCPAPLAAPRTTTIFTVVAMNSDSCYASDTITVYVNNEPSRFIPTAFTPNEDGLNDRFEFDVLGATNLDVSVFNRWGERIYYNPSQTNGVSGGNGWDGTAHGKPVPHDTYVYRILVTYFDDAVKEVTGTITVMK